MQRIDAVVAAADGTARLRVAAHERVERVGEHGACLACHLEELGLGDDGARGHEALRRLRDVHGVVADALQVVGDFHRGGEEAEVAGHRLLSRQ